MFITSDIVYVFKYLGGIWVVKTYLGLFLNV